MCFQVVVCSANQVNCRLVRGSYKLETKKLVVVGSWRSVNTTNANARHCDDRTGVLGPRRLPLPFGSKGVVLGGGFLGHGGAEAIVYFRLSVPQRSKRTFSFIIGWLLLAIKTA